MPDPNRHAKQYAKRFTLAMVTYAVLLVVAILAAGQLDGVARTLVMLLPLPGVLMVAWALWRYLVGSDEMIRHDQLVALALAFGLGSIITFTYGLLQLTGAPELGWIWIFPVYAGCWLVAHLVQWLRNR